MLRAVPAGVLLVVWLFGHFFSKRGSFLERFIFFSVFLSAVVGFFITGFARVFAVTGFVPVGFIVTGLDVIPTGFSTGLVTTCSCGEGFSSVLEMDGSAS